MLILLAQTGQSTLHLDTLRYTGDDMGSYCDIAPGHPYHGPYHEKEYGFPIREDSKLFERLVLEINQAGLSWLTILMKRENFRAAFHQFDLDRVAAYGRRERSRLMRDAGIIRNELKINATIENARRIQSIRKSHGSFARWLDAHHPLTKEEWVKLFKRNFLFTGGEITGEFLISTGYLPGAHIIACPIYERVAKKNPPWMKSNGSR